MNVITMHYRHVLKNKVATTAGPLAGTSSQQKKARVKNLKDLGAGAGTASSGPSSAQSTIDEGKILGKRSRR